MPFVNVLDKKGNSLQAEYLDNFFFPRLPLSDDLQSHLDLIRDLDIRDDDVMICAYVKCGTHWVWEMVQMLRAGNTKYDTRTKETLMIDFMPKHELDSLPSPRTLNSHFLFRHLPKQVAQKKTKIICITRDPRDVAVSYHHHLSGLAEIARYDGQFNDFLPLYLHGTVPNGSWFDYTKDWQQTRETHADMQFLCLYFEEIKKNPTQTVHQLSEFLGVSTSPALCSAIADACDFSNLKAADAREKTDPLQFIWKEDHVGIYRKGETGDWKNWFTVMQSEEFDDVYSHKMADTQDFERYLTGTS